MVKLIVSNDVENSPYVKHGLDTWLWHSRLVRILPQQKYLIQSPRFYRCRKFDDSVNIVILTSFHQMPIKKEIIYIYIILLFYIYVTKWAGHQKNEYRAYYILIIIVIKTMTDLQYTNSES